MEGASDDAAFAAPLVTWSTGEASPSGAAISGDTLYVAALRGERLWAVPLEGDRVGHAAGAAGGRVRPAARGARSPRTARSGCSRPTATVAATPPTTTTASSASCPSRVSGTPAVSADGTIAYGNVSWDVVPTSLDSAYLSTLDTAVQPARQAGLTVEYGGGAGQIGQAPDDRDSEIIGLTCALLLLLIMFASIVAAAIPLVAAIFSVGSGLALVGLLAAATTLPTSAPTVATLLGLGVAVDYGLFLVARHREQLDHGMPLEQSIGRTVATSGAAIVVAGSTVVVAILGLYVSGVAFVGALGLASAVVVAVTMLSALTLVPAMLAVAGPRVRSGRDRRAEKRAEQADLPVREPDHENTAFARWGRMVSDRPWPWAIGSVLVLVVLAIPLFSLRLGQLDAGTDPTSQSSRRAYDLITQGFGPGANGPITVVVELPAGTDPSTVLGGDLHHAAGDARGGVGRGAGGQPVRARPACSTSSRRPRRTPRRPARWSTGCAPTCCPRSARRPTWSAPWPGTSTSPRRSPAG